MIANPDAATLTDLRCGWCGNPLNMTLSPDKEWLLSCSRGSCERFNVKYHAPELPLIRYEDHIPEEATSAP